MKVLATIQLLVALLSTATAADSVRGASQLRELAAGTVEPFSASSKKKKKSITTFSQIKLTQANEISPFIGVPFATGIAKVKLDFDPSRSSGKWKVCIQTNVIGFTPGLLHIHKDKIDDNGSVVVNFSSLLGDNPIFDRCVVVDETTFNDLKNNPELFYVNAHVAGDPVALFNRAIRGQLIQRFRTTVVPSEEVSPFIGKSGASGTATIAFEAAGTVMCIDATIKGFDPVLAHLHNGIAGSNGAVVVNFSSKKVSPGRFLGCGTLSELGVTDTSLAVKILDTPTDFYFNFHLGQPGTSDFNAAIRGQLD